MTQTEPQTKPQGQSAQDKVAEAKAKAEAKKGAKTEDKREYSAPKYDMEVVTGDLPENFKPEVTGRRGRIDFFKNLFVKVKEEGQGQWVRVATYQTGAGARNAVKAIEKGDRDIGDEPENFEVTARRIPNPEDPKGKPWSQLFARYTK